MLASSSSLKVDFNGRRNILGIRILHAPSPRFVEPEKQFLDPFFLWAGSGQSTYSNQLYLNSDAAMITAGLFAQWLRIHFIGLRVRDACHPKSGNFVMPFPGQDQRLQC